MNNYSYLAGVLDLQGQLALRPIARPLLSVSTIELDFLRTLQVDFGGEISIFKHATPVVRTVYRWAIEDRRLVQTILEGVQPFLRTNLEQQAEILAIYLARQPIRPLRYRPTFFEYKEFQQVELALRSLRNTGRPGWGVPNG